MGGAAIAASHAATARADSLSPLLIPGFATSSAGWGFVILATLLAALIEIPYVARAGVQDRVWRRTLLANVISTVGGIFFPAYLAAHSDHTDVYIAVAVALSILIEGTYLCWTAARRLNWGWLAMGSLTSSIALLWLSSIWVVSMDRTPDALRDLGAKVDYSWYRRTYQVGCVNAGFVDDATLEQWVPHLNALGVRYLDLSRSVVTDKGLMALTKVPTLTWLHLDNTRVSEEGIGRLQRALPRVVVYPAYRPQAAKETTNTGQPQGSSSRNQPSTDR